MRDGPGGQFIFLGKQVTVDNQRLNEYTLGFGPWTAYVSITRRRHRT